MNVVFIVIRNHQINLAAVNQGTGLVHHVRKLILNHAMPAVVVPLHDIKHLQQILLLVRISILKMNLDQAIGIVDFVIRTILLVEVLVSSVREKNKGQEF